MSLVLSSNTLQLADILCPFNVNGTVTSPSIFTLLPLATIQFETFALNFFLICFGSVSKNVFEMKFKSAPESTLAIVCLPSITIWISFPEMVKGMFSSPSRSFVVAVVSVRWSRLWQA
jgi:hypothetical protein